MTTLITNDDLRFLREMTQAVLDASTVPPGKSVAGHCNTQKFPLIAPGGGDCYPAFWTRDFVMSADCGLIPGELLKSLLFFLAGAQADEGFHPTAGAFVPAGAITDHIRFDGTPIYYPGTNDFEGQDGRFGILPPFDDNFYFIHLAYYLVCKQNNRDLLSEECNSKSLLERLQNAFAAVPADENGLVCNRGELWGISFGFTDTVQMGGSLLFASLLRFRAAKELAEMTASEEYAETAELIFRNVGTVFTDASGLLRAATGTSGQPDVWGSALAVYLNAVDGTQQLSIAKKLAELYHAGRISCGGAIRHVPLGEEFASGQCWEKTIIPMPLNTYQNGAYWSTPTGIVAQAVAQADADAAKQLVAEFIADLRKNDFRLNRPECNAPYECFHPETGQRNSVYLTSVSCPLAALKI